MGTAVIPAAVEPSIGVRVVELVKPALVSTVLAAAAATKPDHSGVILYEVAYVAEVPPTATAATNPPQVGAERPNPSTVPRLKLTSLAEPTTTLPPNAQAAPPFTVVVPAAKLRRTAVFTETCNAIEAEAVLVAVAPLGLLANIVAVITRIIATTFIKLFISFPSFVSLIFGLPSCARVHGLDVGIFGG